MKNLLPKLILIFSISIFNTVDPTEAQSLDEIVAKFLKRTYTYHSTAIPYRLFIPENYDSSESYPLVLCLHGAGERGSDNELHIRLHRLATSWADTINQSRWPCFVVAPQCPANKWWVHVNQSTGAPDIDAMPVTEELLTVYNMLDSLIREFNIDQTRLYVTGLSMGGYGTWDLIARYPDRFAAAIPMSGAGDTSKVNLFRNVPVWNFHGRHDNTVPVKYAHEMNEAYSRNGVYVIQAANITEDILDIFLSNGARHLYWEYPDGEHVIWAESYDYPKLFPWVFSQKTNVVRVEEEREPARVSFRLNQNYPNPFNPNTTLSFVIDSSSGGSFVTLKVYDVLGNEVAALVNEEKPAGMYEIIWNAAGLSSGVYFCQAIIMPKGTQKTVFIAAKKMILLR